MPQFYFHTEDGSEAFRDQDGVDLDSVEMVPVEAMTLLRDLMTFDTLPDPKTIVATVCDITGAVVFKGSLSMAVEEVV